MLAPPSPLELPFQYLELVCVPPIHLSVLCSTRTAFYAVQQWFACPVPCLQTVAYVK